MNVFDIRREMNDVLPHGGVTEAANLEDLWIAGIVFEGEETVRNGHCRVIVLLVLENGLDV